MGLQAQVNLTSNLLLNKIRIILSLFLLHSFSASWSTPLQLLLSYLILVLCSMTMRVDAKVVMLGKESVGKTSLVERYVHHRFLVGPYQNVSIS